MLDNQELVTFISKRLTDGITPKQLEKVAEDFLDAIIAPDTSNGTGCDNMSTIIIVFKK